MSGKNTKPTRQAAKRTGIMGKSSLCRKLSAELFEPAADKLSIQTEPVIFHLLGLPNVWGSRKAPANAAGFFRQVLPAEGISSAFSKAMRGLTEHKKWNNPAVNIIETEVK
ncbi:MAG: hypothetical protein FWH04_04010 [Oscillospiraceae bacterium]|nr:hypothetical protein [Oscillospiraceae bacterium]